MEQTAHSRRQHLIGLWKERLWGKWLSFPYALAGLFAFVRDEFWRPKDADKWWIINMIPQLSLGWWIAGAIAIICFWIFESSFRRTRRLEEKISQLESCSPLRIIFDASNPHKRFWERTSPRDGNGNILPGVIWEYRVKVRNTSLTKTVKNVRISKESSGLMPVMPADLVFQKDGKQNRDLQPLCGEFVVVFWKFPPQAGDAWGKTATAFHGPIKIIASGDDVLPEECEFDYYPDQLPVIVQRGSSQ